MNYYQKPPKSFRKKMLEGGKFVLSMLFVLFVVVLLFFGVVSLVQEHQECMAYHQSRGRSWWYAWQECGD